MRGARVQNIVQELRGEKIDIVPYDRDPARYVIAAIQPAEVSKVIVDETGARMEIVVPDEKLSLAIGRKGQNVRLASQLTDWKLDVISESKFRKMEEEAVEALQQIDEISEPLAKSMYRQGFRALEEVAEASVEELASIPGFGDETTAQRIKQTALVTMERLRDERVRELALREEPPSERERMLCVPGIGARTLTLLEDGGYKTLAAIVREDADRLGIRTGLGLKKAAYVKRAAEEFSLRERDLFLAARAAGMAGASRAAAVEPTGSEPAPAGEGAVAADATGELGAS
jgi:N utilization substance protein A